MGNDYEGSVERVDVPECGQVEARNVELYDAANSVEQVHETPNVTHLHHDGRPGGHPCIKLHAMDAWPFTRGGEAHRIRIGGPFSASTVDAVRAACMAGVGVAMLAYWDVHEQIEGGQLKRIVLADVEPLEVGIWAVFPTRAHVPARVRAFIDALRDRLLASTQAATDAASRASPSRTED